MQKILLKKMNTPLLLLAFGIFIPKTVFALAIPLAVPVEADGVKAEVSMVAQTIRDLNTSFDNYVFDFKDIIYDKEQGSLRSLLSLNPQKGDTAGLYLNNRDSTTAGGKGGGKEIVEGDSVVKCDTRKITDPNSAKASPDGAWEQLLRDHVIDDSDRDFGSVMVNNSTSLSCLLQEIVEQNKLQINLQIHGLLRQYLNDALATGLAQRKANIISKANIDWAKRGNVITTYDTDGTPLAQETYSIAGGDPEAYNKAMQARRTDSFKRKILADKSTGNSLGVCQAYKYSTARALLQTAHNQDEDMLNSAKDALSCTLVNTLNPNDGLFQSEEEYQSYLKDQNSAGKGPIDTYMALMMNPQNTKKGLEMMADASLQAQKAEISERINNEYQAGGGYLATRECDPDDPTCDISTSRITSPGSLNAGILQNSVNQQFDAVKNVKSAVDLAATNQNSNSATDILTGGLQNYDTSNLNPDQDVSKYVEDFISAIKTGYFDLQNGTKDWATGAMLQIYDSTMSDSASFTKANNLSSVPSDAVDSLNQ